MSIKGEARTIWPWLKSRVLLYVLAPNMVLTSNRLAACAARKHRRTPKSRQAAAVPSRPGSQTE
ncbi:MAG: hypothetical protein K2G90_04925 [Muribaculaceae bacterium]|nr:hypothetical protein [Muribaculaceae bacterium]